ncbi:MAG: hypothetical protein IJ870_03480 [Alphaproteobacteria bacterium]|nr:hypothetical protein [Alphaproteobacteria bacterium]
MKKTLLLSFAMIVLCQNPSHAEVYKQPDIYGGQTYVIVGESSWTVPSGSVNYNNCIDMCYGPYDCNCFSDTVNIGGETFELDPNVAYFYRVDEMNAYDYNRGLIAPDAIVSTNLNINGKYSNTQSEIGANTENYGGNGLIFSDSDAQAIINWIEASPVYGNRDEDGNYYLEQTYTVTPGAEIITRSEPQTPVNNESFYAQTKGKRIYTVEEATKLSKPTGNTFKLRYK